VLPVLATSMSYGYRYSLDTQQTDPTYLGTLYTSDRSSALLHDYWCLQLGAPGLAAARLLVRHRDPPRQLISISPLHPYHFQPFPQKPLSPILVFPRPKSRLCVQLGPESLARRLDSYLHVTSISPCHPCATSRSILIAQQAYHVRSCRRRLDQLLQVRQLCSTGCLSS